MRGQRGERGVTPAPKIRPMLPGAFMALPKDLALLLPPGLGSLGWRNTRSSGWAFFAAHKFLTCRLGSLSRTHVVGLQNILRINK
jgi:hypothetical protein